MTYQEAQKKLAAFGQEHVLKYYDGLEEAEKKALLTQIGETDFSVLAYCKKEKKEEGKGEVTPLSAMELTEIQARKKELEEAGVAAIRAGKVGAVLLAGGMGTRLGSDNPKGMFDVGLTRPVYIFERIIRNLLDVVEQSNAWVHLFVMTSEKNHDVTKAFLKEHGYFGYKEEYVTFFKQDMAPASDYTGKAYLEEKGRIATSPNGNGGWFLSMAKWGVTEVLKKDGIEWLNVFSVDNVLQRIADPCFVGATILSGCAAGSKVVRKANPDEKVGVMCLEDGRPSIVEYYELTAQMRDAKNEKGEPAYNFGVILNYLFRVKDLEEIRERNLPLHVVEKKIECLDEKGEKIKPEEPNGYKFEQLVLDMIHELPDCLPFEVVREKEFAPVKNRTGVDSVDTARELLVKNGVTL